VNSVARSLAASVQGLACLWLAGCDAKPAGSSAPTSPAIATSAVVPASAPVAYTYEVVRTFPHDRSAFTQGLSYLDGKWLESTGLNGHSSLRRVDFATGQVLQQVRVPSEYFAEGMTALGGKIYQLTWQNHKGFVYDLATFALEKEFAYTGEGWGLTTDGKSLILSDGTDQLRFLDPATFAVTRTISVTRNGAPLRLLNELEFVRGEIYANIWQSQSVARIDPATGRLLGVIDFYGLLPDADRTPETDVLNGIAYDAASDRLFVTGKKWPTIFEVRLRPKP
jgi:glutamine cyclotransferase